MGLAPPHRPTFPTASPEDVAIVIHLYAHGYNIMHPHDTRHCTELLPYDKAAMKLLRAVDMNRIPSELVGVLNEASPRQSWNGTITVEVRDYRADHLDMDNSRKRQALMPSVRRVRLHPTPESRLREIHALAKDYRPKGPTTWSEQEWVGLEGRVLPMVQAPLCLDPSVLVFCLNNVTHYNKSKYAPFNQDKYAVRLNQERAVQEKEEEIVVAGVVKTEALELFGDDGLIQELHDYTNARVDRLRNKIYIDLIGLAIAIVMVILFLK